MFLYGVYEEVSKVRWFQVKIQQNFAYSRTSARWQTYLAGIQGGEYSRENQVLQFFFETVVNIEKGKFINLSISTNGCAEIVGGQTSALVAFCSLIYEVKILTEKKLDSKWEERRAKKIGTVKCRYLLSQSAD